MKDTATSNHETQSSEHHSSLVGPVRQAQPGEGGSAGRDASRTPRHEAEQGWVAGEGKRCSDEEGQPKAANLRAIPTHHRPDDPANAEYRLLHHIMHLSSPDNLTTKCIRLLTNQALTGDPTSNHA